MTEIVISEIPPNTSGELEAMAGDFAMTCGGRTVRLKGTHIFRASAGRRQIFVAYEDTTISMSFATRAKTLLEAEAEFTDETDLLMSRGE